MANLPIDVRALLKTGSKLLEQRDMPVRIAVVVELDAPDELVDAVREGFRPRTGKALVDVEVVKPGEVVRVESTVDAVVVLIGGAGPGVTATLVDLRHRAHPHGGGRRA